MRELNKKEYFNKVLGSWLGRIAGDFVGAPLEFKPYRYIRRRYKNLSYFPKKINLDYVNDDEMYEICALLALEKYGPDLTANDIAKEWLRSIYKNYFTAEKAAINNLRKGIFPPLSGKINNIFYDAIGAQMRADIWGQITPGCPELAKYYAEMDGTISHSGIGIEGEVFVASLISEAFFENNIRKNIEKVLKLLPPPDKSLYSYIIFNSIRLYEKYPNNFRKARKELMRIWKEIRWSKLIKKEPLFSKRAIVFLNKVISGVHVLPNAGIIVLSLLYGAQDEKDTLGRSICVAAMMGLDTDCNCGNVGAIVGAQIGAEEIPDKWKKPLKNTFSTYVKGYEKWKITELAERIVKVGETIIKDKGQGCVKIIP